MLSRMAWNKGKKLSEEHKRKISSSCQGMNQGKKNPMYNVRLIPWNKGKHYTWSKEAKEKHVNCVVRGSNHPNWKGGISKLNNLIRQLPRYYQWRNSIFLRDDYTCQKCNIRGGYLEAHHKTPLCKLIKKYNIHSTSDATYCKELWKLKLGETLCKKCHNRTKGGRFKD